MAGTWIVTLGPLHGGGIRVRMVEHQFCSEEYSVPTLRCVFCGARVAAESCVWVRLPDGADFVCCPTVCAPMQEVIESHRREVDAARHQIGLPLPVV